VDRRRLFWVIAAVLAVVVLVLLNRPGGEGGEPPAAGGRSSTPAGQPAPAAAATHPADTGVPTSSPPPEAEPPHEPSGVTDEETLDPAAVPGALRAAEQFAELWSTPDRQWYDRLAGLATPALAEALATAEPPAAAHRIVGDGEMYFDAPEWARIGVPAEHGTVVLAVVVVDGEWLVSAVDWSPS
jgi:hypothetical protein